MSHPECPTCICGKRAPVQGDYPDERRRAHEEGKPLHGPGTISWEEHLLAWSGYAAQGYGSQSAERLAQRGGFGYGELVMFLGHEPKTWRPGAA